MNDEKPDDERRRDATTPFGWMHEMCVEAVDEMLRYQSGELNLGDEPIVDGEFARKILRSLEEIAGRARAIRELLLSLVEWLQREGLKRGWIVEFDKEYFSSAHLASARFLDTMFVQSFNAQGVFGEYEGSERQKDFVEVMPASMLDDDAAIERIESFLGARPIVHQVERVGASWERIRHLLRVEAMALGHEPLSRDPGERHLALMLPSWKPEKRNAKEPMPRKGQVVIDHRVRRVRGDLVEDGSQQVTARQMDLLLLLGLARRRNEWWRTVDLKKSGAIGNPSEVMNRLSGSVRQLVESGKKGWRLGVDFEVLNVEHLTCGRFIDWKTLEVVDKTRNAQA
jgi:hypothetical protein